MSPTSPIESDLANSTRKPVGYRLGLRLAEVEQAR